MKKRTKIIILSVMVVLLGVTGYLNVVLNNSVNNNNNNQTAPTASYFVAYRNERESKRDQEMLYYDAIIAGGSETDAAVQNAKQARVDLVKLMEKELVVEGLIKAKGFEDCVVTLSEQNVNVVVKAQKLNSTEVAKIVAVIQTQMGLDIDNIKILQVE